MTEPRHPAKFSATILAALSDYLTGERRKGIHTVLDPFAGVGSILKLRSYYGLPFSFELVEIEEEWAYQIESAEQDIIYIGDMRKVLPELYREPGRIVITSPTYGNRLSDHHRAKDASRRRSYTHDLGRDLTPGNSGVIPFGEQYEAFHMEAWKAVYDLLTPGALFLLNVSDFIRKGERVHVVSWHVAACRMIGFEYEDLINVATPRMRHGANADKRVESEAIIVMRKQ